MRSSHLIQQIKQADPNALQYIYNHGKDYCIGRLCRTTRCHASDAEDIFMDAILIFRENVMKEKLTEVTYWRAYLYRICQNRYHEQRYQKERAQQTEDAVRAYLYESTTDLPDNLPQKKALVMQAFRYLGENCRRVLHYYYFDHLTWEEIAQRMNLASTNVVKVTKSRCYKKWIEAVAALKQKKDA